MLAAFREVVAKPAQSTVRIFCEGKEVALGTIVSAEGHILTRASDLKGTPSCQLKNGKTLRAKILGIETKNDLALLKVEAKNLTPIEWRDSKTARPGAWLASAGIDEDPVAIGVVSVPTRTPTRIEQAMMAPPASAPPNSGFLGVGLEPDDQGPKISEVQPGGPAAKAGFKAGDIVLMVSGKKVANPAQLVKVIQGLKPGDQVTVKVKREDEEVELKAKLAKRPMDRADFQNSMGSTLSKRRSGFPTILQHDTIIKPTDCGGPLVDLDGKAVGINISRAGRVESYAIPSEVVKETLPELLSGKLAPKEEEPVKIEKPKERPKAVTKLQAAEYALQDAEDALAKAREKGDKDEIRVARQKLADAQDALAKLKAEQK